MKVLYIFPHPDDESFGPGPAIAQQLKNGHDVHLLTLTKGGATKQRFKYNYSVEEMGNVRFKEMLCVEKVLNLTGMNVIDLPDSGLKEMDPREIEEAIAKEVKRINPDVMVTYAVHGVSGFHDHLVSHAVVKRVYCDLKGQKGINLKRLALYTVSGETTSKNGGFQLQASPDDLIDCIMNASQDSMNKGMEALDCYKTYTEVIEKSGVKDKLTPRVCFEFFQEDVTPPCDSIFYGLD